MGNQLFIQLAILLLLLQSKWRSSEAFSISPSPSLIANARNKKRAILAIDGGGLRGIVSATVLKRVEQSIQTQTGDAGQLLGESFDAIAGTSTGSILASYFCTYNKDGVLQKDGTHCRGEGVPDYLDGTADSAVKFYEENADEIFGHPCGASSENFFSNLWRMGRRAVTGRAKHSTSETYGLDHVLKTTMGNLTMKELAQGLRAGWTGRRLPTLLMMAFDMTFQRPIAFVADSLQERVYCFRLEQMAPPFTPSFIKPFASRTGRLGSGRLNRIMNHWRDLFQASGSAYYNETTHDGFEFGPITFLGDSMIERDDFVEDWISLQYKALESVADKDEAAKELIVYGKTNTSNLTVWEAARASASAPTYLPPLHVKKFYTRHYFAEKFDKEFKNLTDDAYFCDGGIVANNPGEQALLYLMARDQTIPIPSGVIDDYKYQSAPTSPLQNPTQTHEPNPIDNVAVLSIGSGVSVGGKVDLPKDWDDTKSGSEYSWIRQNSEKQNIVDFLMENSQMIAHANLCMLYALAGCDDAYLRIQYRARDHENVPRRFSQTLRRLDEPDPMYLKTYKEIGEYLAKVYEGHIDQFVFWHVLTGEEREKFKVDDPDNAKRVQDGLPIIFRHETKTPVQNPATA